MFVRRGLLERALPAIVVGTILLQLVGFAVSCW
jgi:hypothetical protein